MAQVEFQYIGNNYIIQCQEDQKMIEICNNFISKSNINENEIYYFYDGKGGDQFDKNLTFNQMANSFDKERKIMKILVIKINENQNNNNNLIRSKDIICPECGEDIKIKINNYKISLFGCKNNHKIDNISLSDFEKTQIINLTNIKCEICQQNNKCTAYNNEFYKCYECNLNICPLCKSKHDKNHNIYSYDVFHYICGKHNEYFTNYCNQCKINLCSLCVNEHSGHNMIFLPNIMPNKNDLITKLDELKISINLFNSNINHIINILNIVKDAINTYYKLEEYIINKYNQKERNYEILYNINEIINNNNNIINDINIINNDNNILNKFNNVFNIYKNFNNEIQLTVKVEKDDINRQIYFLDNSNNRYNINGKLEEHHHDFLKELNESNVELYIDDKKYNYQKYFIPEKEGLYNILLKFNILMTDCSFMFYNCNNIINLDLSSFNSKNVTNMFLMFADCRNITSLDLSLLNTQNVTNMEQMFNSCYNLKSINLSSINTEKVTNMQSIFYMCKNILTIDLSSFNTQNVTNMNICFVVVII